MILKVDVKAMTQRGLMRGNPNYHHCAINKIAPGVAMVSVHPITYEVSFAPKHTPEGWKNFWNLPTNA